MRDGFPWVFGRAGELEGFGTVKGRGEAYFADFFGVYLEFRGIVSLMVAMLLLQEYVWFGDDCPWRKGLDVRLSKQPLRPVELSVGVCP